MKLKYLRYLYFLFAAACISHTAPAANKPLSIERCPETPASLDLGDFSTEAIQNAVKGAPRILYALGKPQRKQLAQLLAAGENPNVCIVGFSLLSISAVTGDVEQTRMLIDGGAYLDKPLNNGGATALLTTLGLGQFETADLLIRRGADLKRTTDEGLSTLHQIAIASIPRDEHMRNLQIMLTQQLLSSGVAVDIRDNRGTTPLMLATAMHNRELVAYLLNRGAAPEAYDKRGRSALSIAKKLRDSTLIGMLEREQFIRLLRIGATDEFVSMLKGCAPPDYPAKATHLLFSAVMRGNVEATKALAKCGADLNKTVRIDLDEGSVNLTPLAFAVGESGDIKLVEALVAAGADVNGVSTMVNTQRPFSALSFARSKRRDEIMKYLIEHGAR